jgi:hypothetical protein
MLSVACQVLRIAEERRSLGCKLELRPLMQLADDHGYRLESPRPRRGGDGPAYVTLHLPAWRDAVFYMMPDRMNFRAGQGRAAVARKLTNLGGEQVEYEAGSSHPPEVRFWHCTEDGIAACGEAMAAAAATTGPVPG